jgi:hypothetical protein
VRILFLTGSLEPGRDGVADYILRLASELVRQGHEVGAIALNDEHIGSVYAGPVSTGGREIPVLRQPSSLDVKKRFQSAGEFTEHFNPDWLSLQYVPFAFHQKGLAFGLGRRLKKLGRGRNLHIMFHELWLGMARESSRKLKMWGWLQKKMIGLLMEKLRPDLVHTQTRLYQELLLQLGYYSEYLPLFTNIPKSGVNGFPVKTSPADAASISLVVFGKIHSEAPISQLAGEAADLSKAEGRTFSLTLIGRCGEEKDRWVNAWRSAGLPVYELGEQPPEKVSRVLSEAAMGIATTAYAVVEKSGAVAAMKEHGLPVLCVSPSWRPRGVRALEPPEGIMEYREGNLRTCLHVRSFSGSGHQLPEIAKQLETSLLGAFRARN